MNHWFRIGCISMASSIGLGAFGAHSLRSRGYFNDPYYKDIWDKASLYHFVHSLGIIMMSNRSMNPKHLKIINGCFLVGITLFSGSLYCLTLTQKKWLGAITPIGGTSFIVGWILAALL